MQNLPRSLHLHLGFQGQYQVAAYHECGFGATVRPQASHITLCPCPSCGFHVCVRYIMRWLHHSASLSPYDPQTCTPHATADPVERARRQDRLQRAEATFEALPVDAAVARAYGRVYAAINLAGRKARGRRAMDLLIASTAIAAGLPLYTRNPDDFASPGELLDIVVV